MNRIDSIRITHSPPPIPNDIIHHHADAESSCNVQLCNIVRCGRGGGDIPHGHSGVYVETGKGSVVNSFIGDNALTGVTVVRGGQVVLKDCDIVSNGAEAVTIEDIDRGTAAMLENNCMQVSERAKQASLL